jgi:predicted dehydrogenase
VETLRVGIVGAGGIARQHARAWEANAPRGTIVAVADLSAERARRLAASLADDDVGVYPDLATMLGQADLDAVDICLPHHLHTEAIIAAARAGKAILNEKPLCTSLEDAAAISDALCETDATFMMAHNQLFQPSLIEARRLLASGALGRPFIVRSIEAFQNRGIIGDTAPAGSSDGESPWAWRADPQRMGGGEVIDTGWHGTYRLLALAGERPVEVTAMTERFAVKHMATEDTGVVMVRFASGAIGEMLTSWAFAPAGELQFEVLAEHGSLAGGETHLLHQFHGWPEPAEHDFEPVHTFTAEVTHFLDVVQRGETSLASFDHAARVLQVTLAAYRSAAERCVVALPEDPTAPGIPIR